MRGAPVACERCNRPPRPHALSAALHNRREGLADTLGLAIGDHAAEDVAEPWSCTPETMYCQR
jgi:hypothetical protein